MRSENILTMHAKDGVSVYPLDGEGRLTLNRKRRVPNGGLREEIAITLQTRLPAQSGGSEFDSESAVSISWVDPAFSLDTLSGCVVEVPSSYDETIEDHVTNFYFFEHLEFEGVQIKFLEREANRFRVLITGVIDDPSGGSGDRIDVEIDGVVNVVDDSDG